MCPHLDAERRCSGAGRSARSRTCVRGRHRRSMHRPGQTFHASLPQAGRRPRESAGRPAVLTEERRSPDGWPPAASSAGGLSHAVPRGFAARCHQPRQDFCRTVTASYGPPNIGASGEVWSSFNPWIHSLLVRQERRTVGADGDAPVSVVECAVASFGRPGAWCLSTSGSRAWRSARPAARLSHGYQIGCPKRCPRTRPRESRCQSMRVARSSGPSVPWSQRRASRSETSGALSIAGMPSCPGTQRPRRRAEPRPACPSIERGKVAVAPRKERAASCSLRSGGSGCRGPAGAACVPPHPEHRAYPTSSALMAHLQNWARSCRGKRPTRASGSRPTHPASASPLAAARAAPRPATGSSTGDSLLSTFVGGRTACGFRVLASALLVHRCRLPEAPGD